MRAIPPGVYSTAFVAVVCLMDGRSFTHVRLVEDEIVRRSIDETSFLRSIVGGFDALHREHGWGVDAYAVLLKSDMDLDEISQWLQAGKALIEHPDAFALFMDPGPSGRPARRRL